MNGGAIRATLIIGMYSSKMRNPTLAISKRELDGGSIFEQKFCA